MYSLQSSGFLKFPARDDLNDMTMTHRVGAGIIHSLPCPLQQLQEFLLTVQVSRDAAVSNQLINKFYHLNTWFVNQVYAMSNKDCVLVLLFATYRIIIV